MYCRDAFFHLLLMSIYLFNGFVNLDVSTPSAPAVTTKPAPPAPVPAASKPLPAAPGMVKSQPVTGKVAIGTTSRAERSGLFKEAAYVGDNDEIDESEW
jgi:hypothetical protein